EKKIKPQASEQQLEKQAAYKEKQNQYRKQQYQKQKQILKEKKHGKDKTKNLSTLPDHIDQALHYFSENGFELKDSLSKESLATAKKQLARVFHPDRGGSPS